MNISIIDLHDIYLFRDDSLTIKSMGELTDMSGTNDAFNSSICSLQVSFNKKTFPIVKIYN